MATLSRDAILGANDRPTKEIKVPEWGGTVRIRTMTACDRDDFEQATTDARKAGRNLPENVRAIIAARCIVDDDGNQLFELADVQRLGEKSAEALGRVFQAVLEMNALEPGAVEEAAKNSSSAPEGGSSSGSRSRSAGPSGKSKPA